MMRILLMTALLLTMTVAFTPEAAAIPPPPRPCGAPNYVDYVQDCANTVIDWVQSEVV